MSHRAAAPERLELAKLQAEIASLRRELASRLDTPVDSAASAAAAISNEAEAAALRAEVDAAKVERAALSQALIVGSFVHCWLASAERGIRRRPDPSPGFG